jgi:type II secretory pathway component GspD/PulD (secretin)
VSLEPPNTVFYNDRLGFLMARTTVSEMERVEAWFEEVNSNPATIQVVIEARLLELSDEATRTPGLEWLAVKGEAGGNRGILTAPQAQVVSRLFQRLGEEVRPSAAPKVVTLSGRRALIEIGEWPINPNLPLQPSALSLEIMPEVEADGYTMKLHVVSRLTQTGKVTSSDLAPAPGESSSNEKRDAVFSVNAVGYIHSDLTNTVRLHDGQTLVVDPQANFKTRDNLVLMITPTIIDPAGNPVHGNDDVTTVPDQGGVDRK